MGGIAMTRLKLMFEAVPIAILCGCATPPIGNKELLAFLQDGITTREDIYLRLAEPNATFEAGRILAYRLHDDESGYILLKNTNKGWTGKYSLVLVIDEHGLLRRHSLIRVKEQFQP